jgi:hypothetical protein
MCIKICLESIIRKNEGNSMIAAMIMCHKNLEQVNRLVQALSHPEIDIFIHIDKKCKEENRITRADLGGLYFVENRISGYLDDRSLIDITLSMINLAKTEENMGKHYDYFMLLSGQDYPIRDMPFIVNSLRESYPMPFIDCNGGGKNNPVIRSKFGKRKLILKMRFYAMHRLKWFPRIIIRAGMRIITKLLFALHLSDYYYFEKHNIEMHCGSAWWILPDAIIDYILKEMDQPYVNRLLATDTPEETFFQILSRRSPMGALVKVKDQKEKQASKTWAYFHDIDKPMAKHPYTFTKNEYRKLIESDYWFGRKFDTTVDPEIMDMLDNYRKDGCKE